MSAERVVYMMKSRRPRTEPWGTSEEEVYKEGKFYQIWYETESRKVVRNTIMTISRRF